MSASQKKNTHKTPTWKTRVTREHNHREGIAQGARLFLGNPRLTIYLTLSGTNWKLGLRAKQNVKKIRGNDLQEKKKRVWYVRNYTKNKTRSSRVK